MTDERLKQRREAWKRMNELQGFKGRGLLCSEIDSEIDALEQFLQTREG